MINNSFMGTSTPDLKIGIAIATYNSDRVIERCLSNLKDRKYVVVIFDDASTDKTLDIAQAIIPDVVVLKGDGSAWWGGGTAQAVDKCFSMECDFVLMLNPDSIISAEDIERLIDYTFKDPYLIAAGLVVRDDDEGRVFWGGSMRMKIPGIPVYTNRYILKKNSNVSEISTEPYKTDEVHGRGVLVSRSVYDTIGTLDWREFPHYGADNDYSMRALSAGIKLMILPEVKVRLVVENSGMKLQSKSFSILRFIEIYNFLTNRKNGEYIRVLWRLNRRHTPWLAVVPSFLFNLLYIIFRKLH
jgi:GT2 family glycosyltransferase